MLEVLCRAGQRRVLEVILMLQEKTFDSEMCTKKAHTSCLGKMLMLRMFEGKVPSGLTSRVVGGVHW